MNILHLHALRALVGVHGLGQVLLLLPGENVHRRLRGQEPIAEGGHLTAAAQAGHLLSVQHEEDAHGADDEGGGGSQHDDGSMVGGQY